MRTTDCRNRERAANRRPILAVTSTGARWRAIRRASELLLAAMLSSGAHAQTPVLMSVSGASVFEGGAGERLLALPVTFAGSNPTTVTGKVSAIPLSGTGFNPATGAANCGAAGIDFESFSNVPFSIPPNTPNGTLSVTIAICGDTTLEPDESSFDCLMTRRRRDAASKKGVRMMNATIRGIGRSARGLLVAFAATLMAVQPVAHACSRVLWAAPDGQVFVGRTQDWTEKANSAFRVYPRGIERTGAVAENPHKWTTK